MALRIKDNVDLKELEKFGFIKNADRYEYRNVTSWEVVGVQIRNNCIYFELEKENIVGAIVEDNLSVLFDLISSGLVEKVGD